MLNRNCIFILLLFFSQIALAQAPEAPGKPLPPGPMQAKVKAGCTQCHAASRITEQHLSRLQWSKELDKMTGLGAVIADSDRKDILDYLTKNFGPQKGASKASAPKNDAK